nr:hypothetical protein [Tanacetum cinerariifolium]
MKRNKVKKFCDGTLTKIRDNLIEVVKKNNLGSGNKRLKEIDWIYNDVMKSNEMVDNIDRTLKRIEHLEGWKKSALLLLIMHNVHYINAR